MQCPIEYTLDYYLEQFPREVWSGHFLDQFVSPGGKLIDILCIAAGEISLAALVETIGMLLARIDSAQILEQSIGYRVVYGSHRDIFKGF